VAWFPTFGGSGSPAETELQRRVRSLCDNHRFGFLDLAEALNLRARREAISLDMLHPNEAGHACVGEALAAWVRTNRPPRNVGTPGG
jgi:lysophospholipase L1-like esterase